MMKRAAAVTAAMMPALMFSQGQSQAANATVFSNPLFNTLLCIIIVLAIMIIVLGNALRNVIGSKLFVDRVNAKGDAARAGMVVAFVMLNLAASGQNAPAAQKSSAIGGLDQATFYTMLVLIAVELVVIGIMFSAFKAILNIKKPQQSAAVAKPKAKPIFDKLNDTVEIEKEHSILLDHDYDGIRELDNNLPPWWKYGFYLTILVAVFYMINYHVTMTAPLQKEEYANSVKKAEAEIAEYMKNSTDNVDESTVKDLTGATDISSGKDLFIGSCSACHGRLGEGGVGPNLTDKYWLHGGSIKDVFKTIKYGVPDKGMKSWREDFSPMQIAQISSFIRTLTGTNPPNAKDKQGELYLEQPADSAIVKADTVKALAAGPQN